MDDDKREQFLALFTLIGLGICAIIYFSANKKPDLDLSRCVPASEKQMDFLRYVVDHVQPGNTLGPGYAVKSNDFANVWMVAAAIHGAGLENDPPIGVWAVGGDPDNPHTWLSVNHIANTFSGIQLGSETDAEISMSDDGVVIVIECVTKNEK